MPIRMNPAHDRDNPPGCVQYDRPFVEAVEEYNQRMAQEATKKALQAAYDEGYRVGYREGFKRGLSDPYDDLFRLNPNSEEAR